jgi:hypothetical protein
MSVEKGLVAALSGVAGGRIYPILPQPVTLPALRYQRISTSRRQSLDGAVGVTEATMQVDIVGNSYAEVKGLADEVRDLLHGYRGAWGDLKARLVHLLSENDMYEQEGDRVTHWVTQRYQVWTDMS